MAIVRFGTLCDRCGFGSRDYANDAPACMECEEDLCRTCAEASGHRAIGGDGRSDGWTCEGDE